MTTSASARASEEDWRLAMVYCLDGRDFQIDTPWDDATKLWDILTRSFQIPSTDLDFVHYVQAKPDDFRAEGLECLLLQRRQDRPTADFLRLALVEIEYKQDRRGCAQRLSRCPRWIPRRTTRASLIRIIGFDGHCALRPERCSVRINHEEVPPSDTILHVTDGDFIMISIPSHPDDPSESVCSSNVPSDDVSLAQLLRSHVRPTGELVAHTHRPWHCKVGPEHEIDAPDRTLPIDVPPEIVRPELHFENVDDCLRVLRHMWQHHSAVEREDEGHVLYVSTWYSDHQRWPACSTSRAGRLLADFSQWADAIVETWDDRVDPDAPLSIYLLNPQPRRDFWETGLQPHVLILQNPVPGLCSVHFSILDTHDRRQGILQHVDVADAHSDKARLLGHAHVDDHCRLDSDIDCQLWWGELELLHGHPFLARHGLSFLIIINHVHGPVSQPHDAAVAISAMDDEDSTSLIQSGVVRKTLVLDDLVPDLEAVKLVAGTDMFPLPTYVECRKPWTPTAVRAELRHWGHNCDVYRFGIHDQALCVPHGWQCSTDLFHYMFCHNDVTDVQGAFLHSSVTILDDIGILRFLHSCGYWRAHLQNVTSLDCGICCVQFLDVQVHELDRPVPFRRTPSWPAWTGLIGDRTPFFIEPTLVPEGNCTIAFGLPLQDIVDFFSSAETTLCRDPTGHDFPSTSNKPCL